jgi:electron transfer flavoprotein beta subunit
MKIAVCIKQVPDTYSEKKLKEDFTLDRDAAEGVMSEIDEYAVEEALQMAERHGGEVTVVTIGPVKAAETLRKALSMGADAGIHLQDDALAGSDATATSYALSILLAYRGFDLIILGSESIDARMGIIPSMLSQRMNLPGLTFAQKVTVEGDNVTIARVSDQGSDIVKASLPAVVSVVEKINEPRYPSFKGIMAAKKKPVETLTCSQAGIDPGLVGLGAAKSLVLDATMRPPKAKGVIVSDTGDGGTQIAKYLKSQKLA